MSQHAPLAALEVADAADDPQTTAAAAAATKKKRRTFVLHDPTSMAVLARMRGVDPRYSALKAASRGHTDIHLREAGTRVVRKYEGLVQTLDTPSIVKRGEREIVYTKRPRAHLKQKYVWNGPSAADDDDQDDD